MDTCVSAVQHLRRKRGGAHSHLLRASDGAHFVTKFMNNPQHLRVLAKEMLARKLGLRLGLPMPRVEVIDVSDRLIETLYRRRLRTRDLISEFRKSNRNPFPNWAERLETPWKTI